MGRDVTIKLLNGSGEVISSEQFRMSCGDFDKRLTTLDENCLEIIRAYRERPESNLMEEYKIGIQSKKTNKRY